jgi:hypothetical protein
VCFVALHSLTAGKTAAKFESEASTDASAPKSHSERLTFCDELKQRTTKDRLRDLCINGLISNPPSRAAEVIVYDANGTRVGIWVDYSSLRHRFGDNIIRILEITKLAFYQMPYSSTRKEIAQERDILAFPIWFL